MRRRCYRGVELASLAPVKRQVEVVVGGIHLTCCSTLLDAKHCKDLELSHAVAVLAAVLSVANLIVVPEQEAGCGEA